MCRYCWYASFLCLESGKETRMTGCTEMAASAVSSNLKELYQRYQEAHNALLRMGNERKRAADMRDETWEDQRGRKKRFGSS